MTAVSVCLSTCLCACMSHCAAAETCLYC